MCRGCRFSASGTPFNFSVIFHAIPSLLFKPLMLMMEADDFYKKDNKKHKAELKTRLFIDSSRCFTVKAHKNQASGYFYMCMIPSPHLSWPVIGWMDDSPNMATATQ